MLTSWKDVIGHVEICENSKDHSKHKGTQSPTILIRGHTSMAALLFLLESGKRFLKTLVMQITRGTRSCCSFISNHLPQTDDFYTINNIH